MNTCFIRVIIAPTKGKKTVRCYDEDTNFWGSNRDDRHYKASGGRCGGRVFRYYKHALGRRVRFENIKKTAEIFGLPEYLVRQKVNSGEIVAIRSGRRIFVNIDKFAEYLNNSRLTPKVDEAANTGRMAPINL